MPVAPVRDCHIAVFGNPDHPHPDAVRVLARIKNLAVRHGIGDDFSSPVLRRVLQINLVPLFNRDAVKVIIKIRRVDSSVRVFIPAGAFIDG